MLLKYSFRRILCVFMPKNVKLKSNSDLQTCENSPNLDLLFTGERILTSSVLVSHVISGN